MSRYHVAPPGRLEQIRQAINDGALGPHASRVVTHMRAGVVWQEPAAAFEARSGLEPEQVVHTSRLVVGADGNAALELPNHPLVDAQLGQTIAGTVVPAAQALIIVARPRDHALLPSDVCTRLDDVYVESVLGGADTDGTPRDTPQRRAIIAAELQGRATAALARTDERKRPAQASQQ